MAVDGVGAINVPVPPAEEVYQSKSDPVADKGTAVAFSQYVDETAVGAAGRPLTVMVTEERLLSQAPACVWVTQYWVAPTVAVDGTGAIADPVPPVEEVYQSRLDPVAVSATAVLF